jgi:hypothetical protein
MSAPADRDYFPYAHSGEPNLPRYLLTRAEGVQLRQALRSGLSYVRKWRRPKTGAPIEEVAYFDRQRELLCRLTADEVAPGGVRLAMAGDLMWLRHGWGSFVSPEVLDYLNGHDVVLGNLESPVSHRSAVPAFWPDYFTYNSDPQLVTSFHRPDGRNTFTALATSNNHSLDRGDDGMADTLDFLDGERIHHAGVRRGPGGPRYVTWEAGGVRFGFYAACWGFNNPALEATTKLRIEVVHGLVPRVRHPVDLGGVRRALADMTAEGVDFKVVYLHWGYEFEYYPCPDLMQVGREVVRAGADLVMGSHPHVVQPLEVCFVNGCERRYAERWGPLPALSPRTGCVIEDGRGVLRKALIVYSLGNFATAMFALHCQVGMVVGLGVTRDPATGRADWHRPEVRFVYTLQRDRATRSRRLVLLDEHLRRCEAGGERGEKLRSLDQFLRAHVLGSLGA